MRHRVPSFPVFEIVDTAHRITGPLAAILLLGLFLHLVQPLLHARTAYGKRYAQYTQLYFNDRVASFTRDRVPRSNGQHHASMEKHADTDSEPSLLTVCRASVTTLFITGCNHPFCR